MRTAINLLPSITLLLATVTILPAQSIELYGKATPGLGGKAPEIWPTTTPRLGASTLGLALTNGRSKAPCIAYLAMRPAQATVGGVQVLLDFGTALPLSLAQLSSAGSHTWTTPLPNLSSILGVTAYLQAYVADSAGAKLGFSASRGLKVRVLRTSLLLGYRSVGGSSDPQVAIDLSANKLQTFSHSSVDNAAGVALQPLGGDYAVVTSGSGKVTSLFDCRAFPPKFAKSFAAQKLPKGAAWHPDGVRLYVVNSGSAATPVPQVQAVFGNPANGSFGKTFPGGNINLGKLNEGGRLLFVQGGDACVVGNFGFLSGGRVEKFNTKLGSSGYHKSAGSVSFGREWVWDYAKIDENRVVVSCSGSKLGGPSALRIIDVRTMRVTKTLSATAFGPAVTAMVAGPHGKVLYVGNVPNTTHKTVAGIVVVDVDPLSSGFGKMVNFSGGLGGKAVRALALTAAGDRLYAAASSHGIAEFDTKSRKNLRNWSGSIAGGVLGLAVR